MPRVVPVLSMGLLGEWAAEGMMLLSGPEESRGRTASGGDSASSARVLSRTFWGG